ncbi:DUF943 family protein [Erwinia phyllosphaerae]|uniref:DUF943 family protein n=1 Tax=Erwinia phyllosphaerae TaxID=2853256 RepID=UPI001FEE96B8|nr:DUF943 family protein [Erwinia phyllosphaerae]MBV4365341.1 DUF943 family protein [Erwinia phyllosphaerae]
MRKLIILLLAIFSCILLYLFSAENDVSVIGAHYDGSTAQIIVDKLPLTDSEKISWWKKNQSEIMNKYNIPSGDRTPFLMVVYAFGDGYQMEGDEDRLCFSDMKPPKNCIDKNILMMIWRTRNGGVKYQF